MGVAQLLSCDLRLKAGGRSLDFNQLSISQTGAARLSEVHGQALELAPGQQVDIEIRLSGQPGVLVAVGGWVTRESTRQGSFLGVDFDWTGRSPSELQLKSWIELWGRPVEPNRRRHPRFTKSLHPAFPQTATASKSTETVIHDENAPLAPSWKARVANLSRDGMLISTSDPLAAEIVPGDGLAIFLEPRQSGNVRIETLAAVRRITEFFDPESEQMMRSFGLRFEWLDADQHENYLHVIRLLSAT